VCRSDCPRSSSRAGDGHDGRAQACSDLAGSLGGTTGDAAADRVIVNATDGDDEVDVSGNAGGVRVRGLVPTVRVLHSETANDSLEINTLAGTDTVKTPTSTWD
jgi:hypothetical protein